MFGLDYCLYLKDYLLLPNFVVRGIALPSFAIFGEDVEREFFFPAIRGEKSDDHLLVILHYLKN